MGVPWKFLIVLSLTVVVGRIVQKCLEPPALPKIAETYWGEGNPWMQNKAILPFKINITKEILDDLKYRLDHARKFVPPLEKTQHYGMNANLLQDIVDFWKTNYVWKDREMFLNKYPQFVTTVQGLDIHFIHIKPNVSKDIEVLPLMIVHGWPGSFREFYDLIPLLTTPSRERDFVFELVVPSIPGYGFSSAATKPGLGPAEIALVFKNLMHRLGLSKFYAQGGDFGAIILQHLATLYPEAVLGFHNNMCTVTTPLSMLKLIIGSFYPPLIVKEGHYDRVYPLKDKLMDFYLLESGYLHIQATKPDTIGVGLRDSPVALAAYILEKFVTGTCREYKNREDGGLKEKYSYADLLDNVMIYWVTGSMPTAVRLYSETFNKGLLTKGITRNPVTVPSACARFKNDFYAADGVLEEIYPNLMHLADYDGGHFPAMEQPKVLAQDIFIAVDKFQKFHNEKK